MDRVSGTGGTGDVVFKKSGSDECDAGIGTDINCAAVFARGVAFEVAVINDEFGECVGSCRRREINCAAVLRGVIEEPVFAGGVVARKRKL